MDSFTEAIKLKERKNRSVIVATATETRVFVKDGRRYVTRQLNRNLALLLPYREAFEEEFRVWSPLRHDNLLPYESIQMEAEEGPTIFMTGVYAMPLSYFLTENPSFVTQSKEIDRIIGEVMDAVSYIHSLGLTHLDLNPSNLLITNSQRRILLINPLSPYYHCEPSFLLANNEFMAPEVVQQDDSADCRADIYSLGAIIQYLYKDGMLPLEYRKVVAKAMQPDPKQRYASVKEMQADLKKNVSLISIGVKAIGVAAFVALLFALRAAFFTPDENLQVVRPAMLPDFVPPEGTVVNNEGFVVTDSLYRPLDDSTHINLDSLYQDKAKQIFQKEFTKKADKVLSDIYSESSVNGEFSAFKELSRSGIMELEKYQEELCKEYGMDSKTGAQWAAEIISSVSKKKMEQLQNKNK